MGIDESVPAAMTAEQVRAVLAALGDVVCQALKADVEKMGPDGPVDFDSNDFAVALATGISYASLRFLGKHSGDTPEEAVRYMAESALTDAAALGRQRVEVGVE